MTGPDHLGEVHRTDAPAPQPRESTGHLRSEEEAVGTGDQRVDAALARLTTLTSKPVAERVGEYEAIHRALQDTLATVDDA